MTAAPQGPPASPLYRRCRYNQRARDDRDQPIKPFHYNQLGQHIERGARRYNALKVRLGRVMHRSRRPAPGRRFSPQVLIYTVAMAILLGLIALIATTALTFDSLFPVICVIIVIAAMLARNAGRGDNDTVTAMTLVAEGICGNCGFSLQGLAPEDDACLVCPECAAAWNALRITRPLWETGAEESRKPKLDQRPDIRAAFRLRGTQRWTSDDCARCVHTPHHRFKRLTNDVRDQRAGAWWKRLTSTLRQRGRVIRGLALITGCAGAVVGFIMLVLPELERSPYAALFLTLLMILVLAVSVGVWLSDLGVRPHLVASELTAHGCCGSCANDLTKTPANANAMRVCDLCRASWLDARFPR